MAQFGELVQQIDSLKKRLDAMRPLDQEREARVMQKFRLWGTYHSNAIEGNSLTQGETTAFLMEGLTAKNKPLKDHLDLRGHSDAINYLLDLVRNKEPLTEAGIRAMHQILLVEPYRAKAETADGKPTEKTISIGQYKTLPNHVRTPTGETHFYATPEDTPIKMHELMEWYRATKEKGEMHPVELAARYHHKFTDIHPFDDGNGRMSRLLMNLMLMQAGYPPVVIRLGERNQYLAALQRADAGEDEDFLGFIGEHVASSLDLFIRAAEGEDVHEPTDLEKEIALLKMSLPKTDELQTLTAEIQSSLLHQGVEPLLLEIERLMQPLCELFADNFVEWQVFYIGSGEDTFINKHDKISKTRSLLPFADGWKTRAIIRKVTAIFSLDEFIRSSATNHFDVIASIEIALKQYGYSIEGPIATRVSVAHHYGENLTQDEIANVAQTFVKYFVKRVQAEARTPL